MRPKFVTALSVVCFVVAVGLAIVDLRARADAAVGRQWPQTVATIERATRPVTYRFQFDGLTYTTTDVHASPARYRVGQQVVVYVNPANPAQSLLERRRQPDWTMLMIAGGSLFLAVAFAAFGFLQSRPRYATSKRGTGTKTPVPRRHRPMERLRPPPSVPRPPPPEESK
jgi:hypothetical protein